MNIKNKNTLYKSIAMSFLINELTNMVNLEMKLVIISVMLLSNVIE